LASISDRASRRQLLRLFVGAPALALGARKAEATDYAAAADVFAAIVSGEAEVDARLSAVLAEQRGAQAFVQSVREVRARHRAERARLRGGALPPVPGPPAVDASLARLRDAQEALVHAHAEGLPALHDAHAVDVLGRHMVDLARELTVIDLWIEAEEQRG
jgi:hypothetical protein